MALGAIGLGGAVTGLVKNIIESSEWKNYVMILVAFVLLYLAISRDFEPLLLLPVAFGMLLINLPGARDILMDPDTGLFYFLGMGVDHVIFPPLIFLGIGAMIDFGPLIANPKAMLVGAGAQIGIFVTFVGATVLFKMTAQEAASVSIIGGADGPTTIFIMTKFIDYGNVRTMYSAVVIAAYSYMALIPIIQPPIMRVMTTKKERLIRMEQLRPVSKREKILFPIIVTAATGIILPDSVPLIGMLMLGNLLKESLVTERLAQTASNGLINTVTIFLGIIVGSKALGRNFLTIRTLQIVALGLMAFVTSTMAGIITVKVINLFSKKKMNPLIGNAGVSAIPMAARISQKLGREYDDSNHLLMHAMGANVAGSIGSVVAAGIFLQLLL